MNELDFVYILGSGSKWFNNEIRYSLRSLKNVNHGQIFIVGKCPHWARNVNHIEAVDCFENKLMNAIHKIRMACMDERISEKFVLMNDDFMFLIQTPKILDYTLGNIRTAIENHSTQGGYYFNALGNTRDLLQAAGITDPINYEVHYPIVFEKRKFLEMTDAIQWDKTGYLFRSIYGNIYGLGKKQRKDTKIYSIDELPRFTGSDLISTSDKVVLFHKFQKFIEEKFPEVSQYEDPEGAPQKRILYG